MGSVQHRFDCESNEDDGGEGHLFLSFVGLWVKYILFLVVSKCRSSVISEDDTS